LKKPAKVVKNPVQKNPSAAVQSPQNVNGAAAEDQNPKQAAEKSPMVPEKSAGQQKKGNLPQTAGNLILLTCYQN